LKFSELNLCSELLDGLDSMGFHEATPIQEQAIPIILNNEDLIACAQTGTGKTAAYILPLLHKIAGISSAGVSTLIIAPTRELVLQIDQQIEGLAYFTSASSIPIYGGGDGNDWVKQRQALENGVDIITATPGRLLSLMTAGSFDFSKIQFLVLDEADRMLDMGFYQDITRIIGHLPKNRQTLMFSATMPPKIKSLANAILHNPKEVSLSISKPAAGIKQEIYLTFDEQKDPLLKSILADDSYTSIILFASTKEKVKKITQMLQKTNTEAVGFHSDLDQSEREEIMRRFKSKQIRMLVGTDIISRGIDVEGISLVINYDAPPDPEDYVHRVGRTARAAGTGTAITFINPNDFQRLGRIESLIGYEIPRIPLPTDMGEAPVYAAKQPRTGNKKNYRNFKKKPFRKKE
jgi:ATP-dependent RNA helicase RhlE